MDRLSFTAALLTARDQVIRAQVELTVTIIGVIGAIGIACVSDPLPPRQTRTRVRVTKRAISKYRAAQRNVDRTTYPATVTTAIVTSMPHP